MKAGARPARPAGGRVSATREIPAPHLLAATYCLGVSGALLALRPQEQEIHHAHDGEDREDIEQTHRTDLAAR